MLLGEMVADLESAERWAVFAPRSASFDCRLLRPVLPSFSRPSLRLLTPTSYRFSISLLVFFVLLGTRVSTGQEVRLTVHGPSMHINSLHDNDKTWGGGGEIAWQRGSWRFGTLAGAYYNSVWSVTMYQAIAGSYEVNDWFGIGLGIMAATGYDSEACYKTSRGGKSCYTLEWARPITFLPMPFISIGKRVKIRIAGSSTLEAGMLHAMGSVRLF